jgi:hypothetical protein
MDFGIDGTGQVDAFITKFGGLTEEYKFYNDTVTLRYDPKDHVYLLVTPEGLERQDGVTTICHIVDKSNVLIPWAVKMMAQKLLATVQDFATGMNVKQEGLPDYYSFHEPKFSDWINQAKSAHKDKLEDAGEVGHIAHAWIESYIKAVLVKDQNKIEEILANFPPDPRACSACIAALDWMQQHNVRWLGTERKVYSRHYKYAGTMDGLCLVDSCNNPKCCRQPFRDRRTVADWKTSNYLYVEFILQTAAYKQAYEEETNDRIDDIWIIRLGKEDAEFDPWYVDEELAIRGWDAFLKALWLSRSMVLVEEGIQETKDYRKALQKAERQAAKEAALKIKCKGADKYKGIRVPRCNNNNPCQHCLNKYKEVHGTTKA